VEKFRALIFLLHKTPLLTKYFKRENWTLFSFIPKKFENKISLVLKRSKLHADRDLKKERKPLFSQVLPVFERKEMFRIA